MKKTGFLFAGQGSQYMGMGKELYENYPVVREIFEQSGDILKMDFASICFDSTIETLSETINLQPALFVVSASVNALLAENGIIPDAVCGFSLGEISALYASGMLNLHDSLTLVKIRGESMNAAAVKTGGAMCAVIGPDDGAIKEICDSVNGYVIPANYNCPGQVVLSGEASAVAEAARLALEKGALKAVSLNVSGAFHSALMDGAREPVCEFSKMLKFSYPRCDFYSNTTGARLEFNRNDTNEVSLSEFMGDYLAGQLSNAVRFREEIENMIADGANLFIEIGAGKTLSGFVRRIDKNKSATVHNVENLAGFNKLLELYAK